MAPVAAAAHGASTAAGSRHPAGQVHAPHLRQAHVLGSSPRLPAALQPSHRQICLPQSRASPAAARPIAFASVEAPVPNQMKTETVADVMTRGTIHCVHPDTTVDQALELLVSNSVTGMPVLDDDGCVVGVVSDYDLLSLEGIADKAREGTGIFPELSMEWNTFRAVQRLISKNAGKTVADVMTEDPLVVRPETNMAAAAKILLDQKVRRLPVVDDSGRLLGIFTRRDVIKAALATRKAAQGL